MSASDASTLSSIVSKPIDDQQPPLVARLAAQTMQKNTFSSGEVPFHHYCVDFTFKLATTAQIAMLQYDVDPATKFAIDSKKYSSELHHENSTDAEIMAYCSNPPSNVRDAIHLGQYSNKVIPMSSQADIKYGPGVKVEEYMNLQRPSSFLTSP